MINFGPATITWESINLLQNNDFELWSSGANNAPDNWTHSAGNVSRISDNYHGNYSAQYTHAGAIQVYQNLINPTNYCNKLITVTGYTKADAANAVRVYISDNAGANNSTPYSGNNNWQSLSINRNINNAANFITIIFIGSNNFAVDYVKAVEGPYTLGKTFGGGSLQLSELSYTGMHTKNLTNIITGGSGVLHMFQWNNSLPFSNNSTIYDYGKLTITCNNMTITIDCAKLFLSGSMSFGTFTQQPFDLTFSFRKSPDTGNIITFS